MVAEFITATVAFYTRFREQYKLRQQIKKQFEHYLDPRQVKALQKDPSLLEVGENEGTARFYLQMYVAFMMSERSTRRSHKDYERSSYNTIRCG